MKLRWVERKVEVPLADTPYGRLNARMEKVKVLQYKSEVTYDFGIATYGEWIDVPTEVEE